MNHCKNFLTGLSASTLTPSAQCQHRSKRVSQTCLNPISNSPFCWQGLWDLAPITLWPLPYRSPLVHSDPATTASLHYLTLGPLFWQPLHLECCSPTYQQTSSSPRVSRDLLYSSLMSHFLKEAYPDHSI